MHHISKAESICETVEELIENSSKPINFIVISIGDFASLHKEHMVNAFDLLSKTHIILETLNIEYISHKGTFECIKCGYVGSNFKKIKYSEKHGIDPKIFCRKCESPNVLIKAGTEVYLEEVGYRT